MIFHKTSTDNHKTYRGCHIFEFLLCSTIHVKKRHLTVAARGHQHRNTQIFVAGLKLGPQPGNLLGVGVHEVI